METKELKIEIPEGFEIDKSKSTFDKIIFKKKEITYKSICDELFSDNRCWIIDDNDDSCKIKNVFVSDSRNSDSNNLTSSKQAEKILALIKLMNTATYLNGDWKPDWKNRMETKYFIFLDAEYNKIIINFAKTLQFPAVYFKSEALARLAIQILGEDVIKLALSTDY